jgi:aromatic-L-amino-acid decarboxylase
MTPDEFRKYGHQIIDWLADYRIHAHEKRVMPDMKPGDIRSKLPSSPPMQAEGFERLLEDLDQIILPGVFGWQTPNFYGFFPANSTLSAVLGDMVSSGLGQVGLSWQAAPALTELEETMTDWLRQMVGLSDVWQGVIQDTASTTTLVALLTARERASDYSLARGGLQSVSSPLIVYVSNMAHSSVDKAALLAGFGRDNVHVVAVDEHFAMRPDALEDAIKNDLAKGKTPCAIVATTGTTTTTAIDPIQPIAEIANRFGVWLHVDSAMAGSAMILPECRHLWRGVEAADSVVLNPHKWLGTTFDCSIYFVRDPQHLVRVMSTNPSYLQAATDGSAKNYRDWGIPLGRRFRALKLWFHFRLEGVEKLQARLRRDLANAQWLAEQVVSTANWKQLAPVPLQTVCVRHEPPGIEGDALDKHTLNWVNRINQSGRAYLTPAILNRRWMARVSIGAEPTEREHVSTLWDMMQDFAASPV